MAKKGTYLNKNQLAFLELFARKAFNISKTCSSISISRNAFYDWLQNNLIFKNKFQELIEQELDEAEEMHYYLRKGIPQIENGKLSGWKKEPDRQALEFFLKTKGKKRGYVEKSEFEVKQVEKSELDNLSFEQLYELKYGQKYSE